MQPWKVGFAPSCAFLAEGNATASTGPTSRVVRYPSRVTIGFARLQAKQGGRFRRGRSSIAFTRANGHFGPRRRSRWRRLVLEPESQQRLKQEIGEVIHSDRHLLDELRSEISPLRASTRRIQPRASTAISLVATDGGNNQIQFDPFLVQIVRVVDSSNNEYFLEAVTPSTGTSELSVRQFASDGHPCTPLGDMMRCLGVGDLSDLSPMIPKDGSRPRSPSWVQAYRELVEWAVLFSLLNKDFGTDTLIIFDGLLRSKVFFTGMFQRLKEEIASRIEVQYRRNRRRIYLTGIAKHSQILTRYRLAMALEHVLASPYPAYVAVPVEIEFRSYVRLGYGGKTNVEPEEPPSRNLVAGSHFLVKFGSGPRDPIWPVDVFSPQVGDAQTIMGLLLADAINGFPVPLYPQCLQRAHENAALVDFDFDILQDHIYDGVRTLLGDDSSTLDVFRLQDADVAERRYQ